MKRVQCGKIKRKRAQKIRGLNEDRLRNFKGIYYDIKKGQGRTVKENEIAENDRKESSKTTCGIHCNAEMYIVSVDIQD